MKYTANFMLSHIADTGKRFPVVSRASVYVVPATAGTKNILKRLDSRFYGNDKFFKLRHYPPSPPLAL